MTFVAKIYERALLSTIAERSEEISRIVVDGMENDDIISDIHERANSVYRRWISDAEAKVLSAIKIGVPNA